MTAKSRQQGFTLLEILISITLVTMMAVGLWSVFRMSVSAWKRGTETIDDNQRRRSILDLVRKQMASIYGLIAPVELESGGALYPIFSGAEGSLQFISVNSLRFQENPGLTMVSYDLVRDRQGAFILVEREAQYLGFAASRESIQDRADDSFLTIFENLTSFSFEYFDPGSSERPARWVRDWNSRETQRLPAAISMTMLARDATGRSINRHLVIPIMAKPNDPRLNFINPFDNRRRRPVDDPNQPF